MGASPLRNLASLSYHPLWLKFGPLLSEQIVNLRPNLKLVRYVSDFPLKIIRFAYMLTD